jgi:hypothetical protein
MWVEAILSKDDLAAVVADLCPLTIALGQGAGNEQYLRLLNPKNVVLVEDRGLRLTCEAEILWPVLGIDIPIRVESLTLMLALELSATVDEEVIVLKPELEEIDVSWVPQLLDRKVKERINQELGKQQEALSWRFFQTLSHFFVLPELLNPVGGLQVQVAWGKLRVSEAAIVLAVSFHTKVARAGDSHSSARGDVTGRRPQNNGAPLARPAARPTTVNVPLPIAVAGGAALLGIGAYLAVGLAGRALRFAAARA